MPAGRSRGNKDVGRGGGLHHGEPEDGSGGGGPGRERLESPRRGRLPSCCRPCRPRCRPSRGLHTGALWFSCAEGVFPVAAAWSAVSPEPSQQPRCAAQRMWLSPVPGRCSVLWTLDVHGHPRQGCGARTRGSRRRRTPARSQRQQREPSVSGPTCPMCRRGLREPPRRPKRLRGAGAGVLRERWPISSPRRRSRMAAAPPASPAAGQLPFDARVTPEAEVVRGAALPPGGMRSANILWLVPPYGPVALAAPDRCRSAARGR